MKRDPQLSLVVPIDDNRPKLVYTAMDRAKKIFLSPGRFPELRGGRQLSIAGVRRTRRPKESALEAMALCAQAVLYDVDIVTKRCGVPYRDGRFVSGVGHHRIAARTGLTLTRVGRAMRRMVDGCGFFTAHYGREEYTPKTRPGGAENARPCKCCKEGLHRWGKKRWASFNAVYRPTERFIRHLGLERRWQREQGRACARQDERRRLRALEDVQQIQIERQRQAMAAKSAAFQAEFTATNAERLTRVERQELARLVRKLAADHPDWGPARVELEARRRL